MKTMIRNKSHYFLLLGFAFLLICLSGCASDDSSIGINPFASIAMFNSSVDNEQSFDVKDFGTEKDIQQLKKEGLITSSTQRDNNDPYGDKNLITRSNKPAQKSIDPQDILDRADSCFAAERYFEAERYYNQYLNAINDNISTESLAEVNHQLGLVAHKRNQHAKAEKYYLRANELVSNQNSEYFFDYAKLMFDAKRFEEAEKCFLQLTEMNPDNLESQKYLGLAILKQRGRSDCLEPLKKGVGELEAYHLLAEECYKEGDLIRGEKFEAQMLEIAHNQQVCPPRITNKFKREELTVAQLLSKRTKSEQTGLMAIPAVGNESDDQTKTDLPVGFSSYQLPKDSDEKNVCENFDNENLLTEKEPKLSLLLDNEPERKKLESPQLLSNITNGADTKTLVQEDKVRDNDLDFSRIDSLMPIFNMSEDELEFEKESLTNIIEEQNDQNEETKQNLSNLLIPALADTLSVPIDDQREKIHSEEKIIIETEIDEPYLSQTPMNVEIQEKVSLEKKKDQIPILSAQQELEKNLSVDSKEDQNLTDISSMLEEPERIIKSAESLHTNNNISQQDQELSELTNNIIHNDISFGNRLNINNVSSKPDSIQQQIPSSTKEFPEVPQTTINKPEHFSYSQPVINQEENPTDQEECFFDESQGYAVSSSKKSNSTRKNQNPSFVQEIPFDNNAKMTTSFSSELNNSNTKPSTPSYVQNYVVQSPVDTNLHSIENLNSIKDAYSSNPTPSLNNNRTPLDFDAFENLSKLSLAEEDKYVPAESESIESWSEEGKPSKNRKLVQSTDAGLQNAINLGAEVVELSPQEYKTALSKAAKEAIKRKNEYEKQAQKTKGKSVLQQNLELTENSSNVPSVKLSSNNDNALEQTNSTKEKSFFSKLNPFSK
ncbi:MAG: tetratricopeptide repeat protein [Planctomycetia bacterium]|nr:tetratricopeptide repeat protein [Planctomycetia bacterium]